MKKLIMLKNGSIIFVPNLTRLDPLHGISLASPKLKLINFRFSDIKIGWHVDIDEAMAILRTSLDVKNIYSPHPETVLQKRLKLITDALVQLGMESVPVAWPKGKRYAFYSYSRKAIFTARPLKILDDEIHFQWKQDEKWHHAQPAKSGILAIEDDKGSLEIPGHAAKFSFLNQEASERYQEIVAEHAETA